MKKHIRKKIKKQPYEKPDLRKIELAAEEVLAPGCKLKHTSGPAKPQCQGCGVVGS